MDKEKKQADDMTNEEIMNENLNLNREIYDGVRKIKRYMLIRTIINIVWLIIIITPIILAIIYLPPYVEEYKTQFETTLQQGQEAKQLFDQIKQLR